MRFFQRLLCLLRLNKIFPFFSAGVLPATDKIKVMRFFQRLLYLLRFNKMFALFSAGTFPAAKKIYAFLSAGTLPAADKIKAVSVSFSGCFACCASVKNYLRSLLRVLCLLRTNE